jgi:dTMP kinase
MKRGKYIVLEGAQGVGKTTMVDMLVHELARHGLSTQKMHEPDKHTDPTTREIRRITQDSSYPMNTRTEVLLYCATRSQSLAAVWQARERGEIVIVDRSYLTTLAVQFYGRGDLPDYQRLNEVIGFAVGDRWPDLTIVLDAPVDILQARLQKRAGTERFDQLDAAVLERIRAGYLWEARQRNIPVVYANGRPDETFTQVWEHVASFVGVSDTPSADPTPVADLLAKSSAAQALQAKQQVAAVESTVTYHTPPLLPDDLQCDYADGIDRMVSARRALTKKLAASLHGNDPQYTDNTSAYTQALRVLKPLLPVACAYDQARDLLAKQEAIALSDAALQTLPNPFGARSEPVRLVAAWPRNELDLLPAMLYETLDLPLHEVKSTVETWPYELKSQLFRAYLQTYPNGKALASARYELDFLTAFSIVTELPQNVLTHVRLQTLTPRYGYDMPPEVEAAGLSDDYDAIFDQSLALHSALQARGYTTEAQYTTLLGHKQRWSSVLDYPHVKTLTPTNAVRLLASSLVQETHPLLHESTK